MKPTFRNGKKSHHGKPVAMCSSGSIVQVADSTVERVELGIAGAHRYGSLVAAKYTGNKQCSMAFRVSRNFILSKN